MEYPKMTQKDFEFIADVINTLGVARYETAFAFVDALENTNPKFKRGAFLMRAFKHEPFVVGRLD